jgi:hypothetical protein
MSVPYTLDVFPRPLWDRVRLPWRLSNGGEG